MLDDLVISYNNTIHPAHGMTPENVHSLPRSEQANLREKLFGEIPFENMTYDDFKNNVVRFEFKIGDYVRLKGERKKLQKATTTKQWTEPDYIVYELCPTIPPTYKMFNYKTQKNEPGRFYKEEMQLVPKPIIKDKPIQDKPLKPVTELIITREILRNKTKINYKESRTNKKK